ncbi:hypothetical protein SAMN04489835_0623 [Mycolicibacterium rutilum]|uniref:Uncharacterized protein n=1 Tax=Mycolicibacterium rutilum TaxID=370526 RepID=A0A1H6IRR0_MYCRU|nr:hypothetical protein SAMN04489835_0623 [Mycolicibacterium rutilum]
MHARLSALGRRFERSFAGEVAISALVTVVVLIGVLWNLPNSELKRAMTPALRPVAAAAGMQQNWQMYAPEPIAGLEDIQIRIRMADASDRVWRWQPGDKVLGPFSWYRWQKLKEQVIRSPEPRAGLVHWVVREMTTAAERPVHAVMFLRVQPLPPPGKDGPLPARVKTLYSESLEGRP